jgi:CMP-N-acetylneuraminic acid synthetase
MKIAALLTGKGSNTLRDKNILPIRGVPLLCYPAFAARQSSKIDRFFVSSDSERILELSGRMGYTKIPRPGALSLPESRHVDVIEHALHQMLLVHDYSPDILVVLLANNISIRTEWITESIAMIESDPSLSAVVPVYEDMDHHPYRAKRISTEGVVRSFIDLSSRNVSTNRQDLPPCYFLCHNFWTLNLSLSLKAPPGDQPWSFMGQRVAPIVVDESIDVHIERDLLLCEQWIERNSITPPKIDDSA